MAVITLSGNVDTLASNKKWRVEIDFNTGNPNIFQEEEDTEFTTGLGDWYYQMDAFWDAGGFIYIDENTTPGNMMVLYNNSVNRKLLPLEKGKRYKISIYAKSISAVDVRIGLENHFSYQFSHNIDTHDVWTIFSNEFTWQNPTQFVNPQLFLDTVWSGDRLSISYFKIEQLQTLPTVTTSFDVLEFGDWEIGSEELKPALLDGIRTSLSIRPGGYSKPLNFRSVLDDWFTIFRTEVCRVRYYDVTNPLSEQLVWRGKIDNNSVKCNMVEFTMSFDVVDFSIANGNLECNTNPFAWDIDNISAPLNSYRTIEELILAYLNYMSPTISADSFYSTLLATSHSIIGKDLNNRYANLAGYNNSGVVTKLGIYSYKYFGDPESPYASTLGELINNIASALMMKIIPYTYGNVLIIPVYAVNADLVTLDTTKFYDLEIGMEDLETRGARIVIKGSKPLSTPTPFEHYTLYDHLPSEGAVMDGDKLRKFCDDVNLMFFSDWVNQSDTNTVSYDLYSICTVSGTKTVSTFVQPTTYVKPTRWQVTYYDEGVEETLTDVNFLEMYKALLYRGWFLSAKKYAKVTIQGTNFDLTKRYKLDWDDTEYQIQSMKINYVENQTELYMLEI